MTKYFVKTTLGNSIVDAFSNFNVAVDNNRFIRKRGFDLNEGDRVFYENQSISTTLEEVIPVLERSLRYMNARNTIFERNRNDELIPRMRTNLLRGLCPRFGMNLNQDLEDIILKNVVPDFNSGLKNDMSEEVSRVISLHIEPETIATIRSWIDANDNRPYCPRRWQTYEALAEINPVFRDYFQSQDVPGGFHYNYKLYVTTHQRIMDYLTRQISARNPQDNPDQVIPRGYRFSLAQEIELVVGEFMHRVNDQFSLAQIISINNMRDSDANRHERANPHLKRGVVNMENSPQSEQSSVEQIFVERNVLGSINFAMMQRYLGMKKIFESNPHTSYASKSGRELVAAYVARDYICDVAVESMNKHIKGISMESKNDTMGPILKTITEGILSGEFDSALGCTNGTFMYIDEITDNLVSILPRTIRKIANIDSKITGLKEWIAAYKGREDSSELRQKKQEFNELAKEENKLIQRARDEYGFDLSESPKSMIMHIHQSLREEVYNKNFRYIHTPITELCKDSSIRREMRDKQNNFITKEQAREVLARYNLTELAERFDYIFT